MITVKLYSAQFIEAKKSSYQFPQKISILDVQKIPKYVSDLTAFGLFQQPLAKTKKITTFGK